MDPNEFVEDADLETIGSSACGSFIYTDQSTYTGEYVVVPVPSFNRMAVIAPAVAPKAKPKSKLPVEEDIKIEPLKGCTLLKHGVGVYKCVESQSTYDGEWVNDKAQGKGILEKMEADLEGVWFDSEICGPGKYIWADGSSYIGEWADGLPGGKGVWSSGLRDIVKWNGVFDKGRSINMQYEVL